MNAPERFAELLRYVSDAAGDPGDRCRRALAERSFTWAGGGVGPAPPVSDDEAPAREGTA
jgi:hypothetical protein